MRILIVSNIELDDTNAAGNTFANWLTDWPDTEVSSLFSRAAVPHNVFCDSFYSVSPLSIVKNIFTPWRIGVYTKKENIKHEFSNRIEGQLIKKTKIGYWGFLHILNDILINTRMWQNRPYKEYVESFNPDIVFYFAKSEAFLYRNLKFLKRYTNAKFVAYFADDMYSMYQGKGLKNWIFRRRFPKIISFADKNYGASVLMCDTYSSLFNISMTPLYKGCRISDVKGSLNTPIRIVYAGNLYYGRDNTLAVIAKALKDINREKQLATLEIYTNTFVTDKISASLNIDGTSKIMGGRPFSEIQEILKNADIVLHVESFDPENIKIVRLSYSTKMSDCLQSGSMMLIVGPNGISSVEEAKLIDGVMIINDEKSIYNRLYDLLRTPELILNAATKTNRVAKEKFPIEIVRKRLYNDFINLINKT